MAGVYRDAAAAGALALADGMDGMDGVGIAAAAGGWEGAGGGRLGSTGVDGGWAGMLKGAGSCGGTMGAACTWPPCSFIISGTISSATMLMILMSGLMAGPAVSL